MNPNRFKKYSKMAPLSPGPTHLPECMMSSSCFQSGAAPNRCPIAQCRLELLSLRLLLLLLLIAFLGAMQNMKETCSIVSEREGLEPRWLRVAHACLVRWHQEGLVDGASGTGPVDRTSGHGGLLICLVMPLMVHIQGTVAGNAQRATG